MTGVLAGAFLLVVASALLSAADAAIFSIGSSRLRTLQDEGFRGAEALAELRQDAPPTQAVLLFLNTLANLFAVGLLVGGGTAFSGLLGFLVSLPGAALLVLTVGELLPRALSARHPIRVALTSAPILLRLERWFRPVVKPLAKLEGYLARGDGETEVSPEEREFREVTELGQKAGLVGLEEHHLVERAFRMDETTAWEVMTPRVDIFAWRDDQVLEEIIGQIRNVPFSRVPVYSETIDEVTGILYVREAYETYVTGRGQVRLSEISREPFFVPGSLPLTRLLEDFQVRRIHMGIVADEFGGTDGLVTLEDVLEELVGDIVDETDIDEEPLIRITRNEIVADGGIDLREINHAFNVSLPILEHRSLNGFLLEELGRVPEKGETVRFDGLAIEIVEASETQVLRARLKKGQPPRPREADTEDEDETRETEGSG